MKLNSNDFRVRPRTTVDLAKWPTAVKPICKSKKRCDKILREHVEELAALQELHYASNHYAVLLIFQAMDAAGKDGAIRHVMSGVNPQGCQVFSFKHPSATELEHDFLWRTTRSLPERGRIGALPGSVIAETNNIKVMKNIIELTEANFEQEVLKAERTGRGGFLRAVVRAMQNAVAHVG